MTRDLGAEQPHARICRATILQAHHSGRAMRFTRSATALARETSIPFAK
jgi:hypothetical protein